GGWPARRRGGRFRAAGLGGRGGRDGPGRPRLPPGPSRGGGRRRNRRRGPGGAPPPVEHVPGHPSVRAVPRGRVATGRARRARPSGTVAAAVVSRWPGTATVLGDRGSGA